MEYVLDYRLIGKRIKNCRLKMKLTQERLAEASGIGIQHLSKIENGRVSLSLTCLAALATALQTTTDYLLADNVTANSAPYLLNEVQAIYEDCTPDEMYILIETSKALKESIRTKIKRMNQ